MISSAGSAGANYRAGCRGKSKEIFIYKIEVVLEDADETLYCLEVSKEAHLLLESEEPENLIKESNELVRISNAADITAKKNRDTENPNITKSQNQK